MQVQMKAQRQCNSPICSLSHTRGSAAKQAERSALSACCTPFKLSLWQADLDTVMIPPQPRSEMSLEPGMSPASQHAPSFWQTDEMMTEVYHVDLFHALHRCVAYSCVKHQPTIPYTHVEKEPKQGSRCSVSNALLIHPVPQARSTARKVRRLDGQASHDEKHLSPGYSLPSALMASWRCLHVAPCSCC